MRFGPFAMFLTGALSIATGIAGAQSTDSHAMTSAGSTIRADGTMSNPQALMPLAHRMEATKTCAGTTA
jgi:hypothetical protein